MFHVKTKNGYEQWLNTDNYKVITKKKNGDVFMVPNEGEIKIFNNVEHAEMIGAEPTISKTLADAMYNLAKAMEKFYIPERVWIETAD